MVDIYQGQVSRLEKHNNGFNGGDSDKQEMKFALSWLEEFGYFSKKLKDWKSISVGDIVDAVKKFQGMYGLKKDGYMGPKSLRAIVTPRCGCPDILQAGIEEHVQYLRARELARNLAKWNKGHLKFCIVNRVSGVQRDQFDQIMEGAFQVWENHCQLMVTPTSNANSADIIIDVGQGRRSNFDGPGGTLAWAYLPNGQDRQLVMKFDLSETWTTNSNQRGILLFNVACHEFGHLLGLDHSKMEGALMAPYYKESIAVPQWRDDIPRIRARYGDPQSRPAPQPVPPTRPSPFPSPTPGPAGNSYVIRVKGDVAIDGHELYATGK